MEALQQHPLSAAFPAMSAEEQAELRGSIEAIGVQNPATLFDGMVLDGWHRYSIATELGIHCPTTLLGDVDPRQFVLAQNRARRSLNASQRAAVVVYVYDWQPVGANQHKRGSAAAADPAKTTKQLAEIAGVGTRTMERAKVVEAKATPEVKAAVKAGKVSVEAAADIAKLPVAEQADAVSVLVQDGHRSATRSAKAPSPSMTRQLRRQASGKAMSAAMKQTRHGASLLYAHLNSAIEMIKSIAESNSEFSAEELEILQRARKALGASSDADDELRESRDTIAALAEEVDDLKARLAIEQMDVSEDEKTSAAELIADLRAQVKTLTAELAAMRISRDGFQAQVRELTKQVQMNRRELERSRAAS